MNWELLRSEMKKEPGFWPCSSEPEVGEVIRGLCRMVQAQRVLEIGMWRGFTTSYILEAMDGAGCDKVIAVDMNDERSSLMKGEIETRYTFVRGLSHEVIPTLTGQFDLVFSDSDHRYEYCILELGALRPKLHKGSIICLHDPIHFIGVQRAIDEVKADGFEGFTLPTPLHPERNFPAVCGLGIIVRK